MVRFWESLGNEKKEIAWGRTESGACIERTRAPLASVREASMVPATANAATNTKTRVIIGQQTAYWMRERERTIFIINTCPSSKGGGGVHPECTVHVMPFERKCRQCRERAGSCDAGFRCKQCGRSFNFKEIGIQIYNIIQF